MAGVNYVCMLMYAGSPPGTIVVLVVAAYIYVTRRQNISLSKSDITIHFG